MSKDEKKDGCKSVGGDSRETTDGEDRSLFSRVRAKPVTRRDFIKGVISSGATIAAVGYVSSSSGADRAWAASPGAVERLISLTVNGRTRRVDVLPQETLAMTLRYKLGLTGTKLSCDRGECGACTVLIDDVAYNSCSTLTHSVRNRNITTIEGLEGSSGQLHPVQKAFVEELGPQCGFCTPGQIMSAVALLKAHPHPTRDEILVSMSGNMCRCGSYDHYLKAITRVAQGG
ncbi:MAG: (2Fe-2S)-binding protein [Desulfobacterales bacterium]|nr:(2Fe-2S)-binding protein [Desulfobacterales bacterium]